MSDPNKKAIAQAEHLLRKLRTGELSGFIAVATDEDDASSYIMGGRLNFTQAVCLLEDMKLVCLSEWKRAFFRDDDGPVFEVIPSSKVSFQDRDDHDE